MYTGYNTYQVHDKKQEKRGLGFLILLEKRLRSTPTLVQRTPPVGPVPVEALAQQNSTGGKAPGDVYMCPHTETFHPSPILSHHIFCRALTPLRAEKNDSENHSSRGECTHSVHGRSRMTIPAGGVYYSVLYIYTYGM